MPALRISALLLRAGVPSGCTVLQTEHIERLCSIPAYLPRLFAADLFGQLYPTGAVVDARLLWAASCNPY